MFKFCRMFAPGFKRLEVAMKIGSQSEAIWEMMMSLVMTQGAVYQGGQAPREIWKDSCKRLPTIEQTKKDTHDIQKNCTGSSLECCKYSAIVNANANDRSANNFNNANNFNFNPTAEERESVGKSVRWGFPIVQTLHLFGPREHFDSVSDSEDCGATTLTRANALGAQRLDKWWERRR